MHHTLLERSIRGLQLLSDQHQSIDPCCSQFSQNRRLGPQNGSGSLRPEKLLKIVSFTQNEKLK